MKKALAFFLILCVVFCAAPFSVAEEETPEIFTSGDWKYYTYEDGTAIISRYSGSDIKVIIPDELDGKVVSGIEGRAFLGCDSMTAVLIPESVINVKDNPFVSCSNLFQIIVSPDHKGLATIDGVLFSKSDKRLVCYPQSFASETYQIPQGIKEIGKEAFFGCKDLTSVMFPDGVISVDDGAFEFCSSLSSVTIPEDGMMSIGKWVFAFCESLVNIRLPNTITSIGEGSFAGCKALTNITIPSGVTSIEVELFNGCKSLINVSIPDSVTSIGGSAFLLCESLTTIIMPENMLEIGWGAFRGCESLSSVTIPGSVKIIGDKAFDGCNQLTVTVSRDSYAKQYCESEMIKYIYVDSNSDWLNE